MLQPEADFERDERAGDLARVGGRLAAGCGLAAADLLGADVARAAPALAELGYKRRPYFRN